MEDLPTFNAPSADNGVVASRNPLSGIVFCRYEDGTAILPPKSSKSLDLHGTPRCFLGRGENVVCSMHMYRPKLRCLNLFLTGIVVMCRDIEDYVSIIRKSCRNDVRNCGTLFKNL